MLPDPCLLLLTDRTRLTPNWTLAQAVAPAITGGCNLVVLREADLPPGPRATVARFVQAGVKGRVPFLTSGDPGFATSVGVGGVLLEGGDFDIEAARDAIRAERLLGVTISGRDEAQRAESAGADFVLIEYDWTNPNRVLMRFQALRSGLRIPIIAGTDPPLESATLLRQGGAAGVAVCSAGMSAYDRTAACRAYSTALVDSHSEGR